METKELSREVINDIASIFVRADEPSNGGASHTYSVQLRTEDTGSELCVIHFQEGPRSEAGLNGLSEEVLIRIVLDRLQGFQRGPMSCRENALTITKLEEGLHWLNHRTFERAARGVEGTSKQ